jgi:hypothetical protein
VHGHGAHGGQQNGRGRTATAVLHVGGLHYASEKAVVEHVLATHGGPTDRAALERALA